MKAQTIVFAALLCIAAGGPTSRTKSEILSRGIKIPPAEGATRVAKNDRSAASPSANSESSSMLRGEQREADLAPNLTPQNVFQLNGADGDTPISDFTKRPIVKIMDWKLASWLNNEKGVNALFEATDDGGIVVKADGVYSIFSNFVFGGVGRDCRYYLNYGETQSRMCRWSGFNGGDVKGINRHQPCALNFSAKLKKNDVVRMTFWNDGKCDIDGEFFKRFLATYNYLGIRKEF